VRWALVCIHESRSMGGAFIRKDSEQALIADNNV
jgi:hypothetical protein